MHAYSCRACATTLGGPDSRRRTSRRRATLGMPKSPGPRGFLLCQILIAVSSSRNRDVATRNSRIVRRGQPVTPALEARPRPAGAGGRPPGHRALPGRLGVPGPAGRLGVRSPDSGSGSDSDSESDRASDESRRTVREIQNTALGATRVMKNKEAWELWETGNSKAN